MNKELENNPKVKLGNKGQVLEADFNQRHCQGRATAAQAGNKFKGQDSGKASGYNELLFEIQKGERLLTKQEIADFLNVSIKTIDRYVHMDEIPYLKVGRLVRFSMRSILTWVSRAS